MGNKLTQVEIEHLCRTGTLTLVYRESAVETLAPLFAAFFLPLAALGVAVAAVIWMVNNP